MKGTAVDTCQVSVGDQSLMCYRLSHQALCEAGLPPSTELVGHRLLAMADLGTGQVNMTWDALSDLTGCMNVGAARRHLSRLAAAGLIHYSTNEYVYVTWLAWMRDGEIDAPVAARQRASSSAPARKVDDGGEPEIELFGEIDAPVAARGRAGLRVDAPVAARQRAGYSHARLFVCQSVQDPGQHKKTDRLTDRLGPARADLGPQEQRRSVALLTDAEVGLDASTAWAFAQRYEFEWLVRQVMTWRRQVRGGLVHGTGALIHRMVEGFGCTVTDEDRKCDLYRRHHGKEERQETRRDYCPDEYADIILH